MKDYMTNLSTVLMAFLEEKIFNEQIFHSTSWQNRPREVFSLNLFDKDIFMSFNFLSVFQL